MTGPRRPITIIGAGVLGRRIAAVFIAGGYDVNIFDYSEQASKEAVAFVETSFHDFASYTPTSCHPGSLNVFNDLSLATQDAWLVIEAIPERLDLKKDLFSQLDRYAPKDCILASNSSSYKCRLIVEDLEPEARTRALNVHFMMPPDIRVVELMTNGDTLPEIFPRLTNVLEKCGMIPITAGKESTGFVFNRLWAAIKREILYMLAEGVSNPREIDLAWQHIFQSPSSYPPCRLMDQVGLDTVAFIEQNYVQERGLDSRLTVDWLREKYIEPGRLGNKSQKGGLYPAEAEIKAKEPRELLYLLDVGLGTNNPNISAGSPSGRIIKLDPATGKTTSIVEDQSLPDGIGISKSTSRIFWTNMGLSTSACDGSVHSANLDGSDVRTLLQPGSVHTPKQLIVDDAAQKIYFCDREGMSVHRLNFDGTGHEILIQTGSPRNEEHRADYTRCCVGIAVDPVRKYIYWTQKGPSKGGKGRLFRAGLDLPPGSTSSNRSDILLLLDNLPEPIDLKLDTVAQVLYWTDRGEHPTGCSLNSVSVAGTQVKEELQKQKRVLARQFHEPIGLDIGAKNQVYVSDLGGSVYRVEDGVKTVVLNDNGCYTGLAVHSAE